MNEQTFFCVYCGVEMRWDMGQWVDIADGMPTECENSPDYMHMEEMKHG